jgi:hypothetical protein
LCWQSGLSVGIALQAALSAGCSDDPVPLPVEHLVAFSAGLDFEQGTPPEAMQVDLLVSVARQTTGCAGECVAESVHDAVVRAGAGESRVALDYDAETGDYHGVSLGYAPRYVVEVDVAGQQRIEREARSPSLFSFELDPEPLVAGAEATIVWTPSAEAGITAVALVSTSLGATYITPAAGDYPDDGREDLPASALPEAGSYEVKLQRRRAEGERTFFGSVTIIAGTTVIVEPGDAP